VCYNVSGQHFHHLIKFDSWYQTYRHKVKSAYMSQVTHQAGAYPSFCSMKRETNKLRINLDLRWPYGITGIHWQGLSVIVHCRPIRDPFPPSPTPWKKILTCDLKFLQLLQLSSLSAQKCASTQLHMSCISLKIILAHDQDHSVSVIQFMSTCSLYNK